MGGEIQISTVLPDLVVSAAACAPTAQAGTGTLVSWTVTNEGQGDTVVTSWTDTVYAYTGATLNIPTAILLASFAHAGLLAAGASISNPRPCRFPSICPAGHPELRVSTCSS